MTSSNEDVKALIAELRDTDLPFELRRRTTAALTALAAERDALSAKVEAVKAWQQGVLAEPQRDSPTVSYNEWVRKALNHLAYLLSRGSDQ